jgi:8-oxo-dGTP pyrophosphatase MutT (NUDIX family)
LPGGAAAAKLESMHRRTVLDLLDAYLQRHPGDATVVARTRSLVHGRADCFERTCLPGHVTGSAWVVSADFEQVLLTHHRKLGRWLQLGGHADGDPDPLRVALREAREESGLERLHPAPPGSVGILDLDVHAIPALGAEPAHDHHDLRFLFVAEAGQDLRISDESNDLRWVPFSALRDFADEESLLRMADRARAVLAILNPRPRP